MFAVKKLSFVLILIFVLTGVTYASENSYAKPEKCVNLTCIREGIDSIDAQIVHLIGQRLYYVKRAGEIKGKNIPIHDPTREEQILEKVGLLAEKQRYSAKIAQLTLLEQSNSYELRTNQFESNNQFLTQ